MKRTTDEIAYMVGQKCRTKTDQEIDYLDQDDDGESGFILDLRDGEKVLQRFKITVEEIDLIRLGRGEG